MANIGETVDLVVGIAECKRGLTYRDHYSVLAFSRSNAKITWSSKRYWRVGYSTKIRGTVKFEGNGEGDVYLIRVREVDG
jgi:hypothetical protein